MGNKSCSDCFVTYTDEYVLTKDLRFMKIGSGGYSGVIASFSTSFK